MEAEERWFWVWLSIFTILLGTAPFAYWQGYHLLGIICAVAGLVGLLMLIRDHLAATASKWPIRVSSKVLAIVTLSMIVGQSVGREIAGYRTNGGLSSVQWWLYGITLLLIVAVVSATLSKGRPSKLIIHWANYRAVENGGDVYEVGEFLRQIISGDSLVFDIENHNFKIGGKDFVPRDPLTSREKRLQVNYSYGGNPPITTERREHGRLLLPEDSKIQWLQSEVERLKAEPADWRKQYLEESQRRTKLQNDYAEAGNKALQLERLLSTRPELPISALHADAMRLSIRLLQFLDELGEPPAPKYTPQQIDEMSSTEMRRLIDRNDGDFIEACEYYKPGKLQLTREGLNSQIIAHCTRLFPWYEKVRARYALEYKAQVEQLRDRFTLYGILDDDTLVSPVQGKDGVNTIRAIARKLWEMAYKLSEDGVYQ
jgi:hypothetical protein